MTNEEKTPSDGLPEEEFSKLLQSVSTVAPLLKSFMAREAPPNPHGGTENGAHDHGPRREALLVALKPYLSPARCEAVDYFIRLARVGDAIRSLQ